MQNIERKLESSFGKNNDLDRKLKSASSTVLTQKIEFQESSQPHSSITDCLKGKYTNLATTKYVPQKSPSCSDNSGNDGEGLPQPKEIIFKEPLVYTWKFYKGAGLLNPFNSCFLNSTLQCLIHTPPLASYLMSGHHGTQCRVVNREKCILCNLQFLTKRVLSGNVDVISPKWFNNNLQYIGRHFRSGRQEDAHEFLRLSLEKMQKCALIGYNHLDRYSKDTTVINKIFGGYLRSQVICSRCHGKSNTYDPLLDISLDIKSADHLERALQQFVAPERLDLDNAYKCEKCKSKVTASKRFTIHKCPNVLTIQLKRFNYGTMSMIGNKLHKPVKFPMDLNLRPYMSNRSGPPIMYKLFGTIQHIGATCGAGHYVANVKCGENWYNFNDSLRKMISNKSVLGNMSAAYILFYLRDADFRPSIPHSPVPSPVQSPKPQTSPKPVNVLSPQRKRPIDVASPRPTMIGTPNGHTKMNGNASRNGIPTNDIGLPVKSPFLPLSANREKIRINLDVKPKTPEKSCSSSKPSDKSSPAPRLVMKIKDGKSITIETSPDGERRILSDDDEVIAMMNEKRNKKFSKKPRIVPYQDDSNSDSDWSSQGSTQKSTVSHSSLSYGKKENLKEKCHGKDKVVFDGALNTTTSVPGNAHLFGTVTMKDKVSHNSSPRQDRPKDLKMFTPNSKSLNNHSPAKKPLTESLSCVTTPHPAKHSGQGEWHTSIESVLSPSVGSNSSSTHSTCSTHDNWTITPNKVKSVEKSASSSSQYTEDKRNLDSSNASYNSSPFTVISDKECLLKPKGDKNSSEYKLYKKMKKKLRKEKRRKREHIEREHNYTELSDDGERRQHKKKKKHKHKYHDDEREDVYHREKKHGDVSTVSQYGRDDKKYHKEDVRFREDKLTDDKLHKRKHERDTCDISTKRSRKESESSSEFEWVEKTVEKPVPLRPSKSEPVTPCRWDHLVKDSSKRKSSSGYNTPVASSWEGLKASSVATELEKVTNYAYGAQVSGWDGNMSHLDANRDIESRYNSKRKDSDDEYNDEYDKGKVKKVKHKHYNDHRYNGNTFQQKQNEINRSKKKWSDMRIGDVNPFMKASQQKEPHYKKFPR
ncbi:Ubiquitin carboxyl-terminal hydrolase 42 [Mactra antiquata]